MPAKAGIQYSQYISTRTGGVYWIVRLRGR
jgi:hypothetical protein